MFTQLSSSLITLSCSLGLLTSAANALAIPKIDIRQNLQPVMNGANFPDPAVIRVNNGWYAFSTNAHVNDKYIHIQVASTPDWKTWNLLNGVDALPNLPAWVDQVNPRVWAPDVVQVNDGSFVMYYTAATNQDPSKHCLGVATSKSVQGPYTPTSDQPWVCPLSQGGAIDVSGYTNSDNTRWVVYKVDGNSLGHGGECMNTVAPIVPTPIMLQQVDFATGTKLVGSPQQILTNIASDGPYVEGPSLSRLNGQYVLFFSTNCFATPKYDIQYATASNIKGPYTRQGRIMATGTNGLSAPGGLDIAVNGDHAVWHG